MKRKKLWAVLLMLAMCVNLVSHAAFAAEPANGDLSIPGLSTNAAQETETAGKEQAGVPEEGTALAERYQAGEGYAVASGGGITQEQLVPHDEMTATANSYAGPPSKAIDGDNATFWECAWDPGQVGYGVYPVVLTLTLKEVKKLSKFTYLPRQDNNANGVAAEYRLIGVKEDGSEIALGQGTTPANDWRQKTISFEPVRLSAVKFVFDKSYGQKDTWGCASEVNLYEQVTAIQISQEALTLKTEESAQLTLDGTEGEAVNWKSSDENIATVDADGRVTGVAEGVVKIRATTPSNKAAVCDVSVSWKDTPVKPGYVLTFADNFDGTQLDTSIWNNWCVDLAEPDYFRYGNTPDSVVAPENVKVEEGSLRLMGTKDPVVFNGSTSNYKMGMVQTRDKYQPLYGYVEAMIRFPDVAGSNPAVWTMPPRTEDGTDWQFGEPAFEGDTDYKFGAEIDILERPRSDGRERNTYDATIHYDNYTFAYHKKFHTQPKMESPYNWHKFGMNWTPDRIDFMLDGKVVATQNKDVPNQEEIFILSWALGGWLGTIDPALEYSEMLVDYVRWYQVDPVTVKMADELAINTGEARQLTAELVKEGLPVLEEDPIVSWTSSSPLVAAVAEDGTVTGKKEGVAEITVTTQKQRYAVCEVSVSESGKIKPGYKLVFEDNFSGQSLDSSKWNNWCVDLAESAPYRYANSKEVALVPENAYVKDGSLRLLGDKGQTWFPDDPDTPEMPSEYRMGAVQTRDKFEPLYGYMETMVRIPDVPGTNPAIWTMPQDMWNNEADGTFGAEIDILERPHPKGDPQYENLMEKYWVTIHYDAYNNDKHEKFHTQPTIKNPYKWHKFAMDWTPDYINFILDDKIVATQNKDVPNSPEIFILSYGMGGWIGKINDAYLPAEMKVDYVRWYQPDYVTVAIDPSRLDLGPGESKQLELKIQPQSDSDKAEMWISSNPAVASVDQDGKVSACSNGTAKIRVITEGERIAVCDVTVAGYVDPTPPPTKPTPSPTTPPGPSGGGSSQAPDSDPAPAPTPFVTTEVTEDGGKKEITTKTETDAAGNKKTETVTIEKNSKNEFVGKTIEIAAEDRKTGSSVQMETKQDAGGRDLEAKAVVTETEARATVENKTAKVEVAVNADLINRTVSSSKIPVQITINLPKAEVLKQLKSNQVSDLSFQITVPGKLTENPKAVIGEIILSGEVVRTARTVQKNIKAAVKNEEGKESYSWTFRAAALQNSGRAIRDVNMALHVAPIKSLPGSKADEKKAVPANAQNGLSLQFSHEGLLPATADISIYVGDREGFREGSAAYLYYYNSASRKLDKLPKEKYTVGKEGYITLAVTHCSDYMLLPVSADDATALLSQVGIPARQSVDIGAAKVKMTLPATLRAVTKYSRTEDAGVKEAKVTCQSSNKAVAAVSSAGRITAKKAGTAKITTKLVLADGTSKSFVTTVTVKNP